MRQQSMILPYLVLPPVRSLLTPLARARVLSAAARAQTSHSMGWTANKVRDKFVEFFESKGHVNWRSSPVVPHDDPTLLFANAGMNQFKPIFLGTVNPNTPLGKLTRACNTQKCIRAGGKHNDLDDVGKDTYHHTFFEMLGNWSFGDYFKEEAIGWAWELLTVVYKLPTDRIYATYFGGDEKAGLAPDNEARDIWLKFLPPERVLPFGCKDEHHSKTPDMEAKKHHVTMMHGCIRCRSVENFFNSDCHKLPEDGHRLSPSPDSGFLKAFMLRIPPVTIETDKMYLMISIFQDNFWEMGDTGPCGPCTEIHFDRIGNRNAAALVNNDDPTCIEIWNLVFIQFNRETDGSLKPLPAKHVDTGMGFERLTSILQNKMSNYDTDVFLPIFDAIQKATGAQPYAGRVGSDDVDRVDMAYRVVADHIRTLSFAIADGSRPGNEGREYVLRRILRRAVRYGTDFLNAKEGVFSGLVGVVVELMGNTFPELKQHEAKIKEILAEEEASFERTLDRGREKFKKAAQEVKGNILSGQDAFVLWDTYGFPLDLTQLMAEEKGLTVDVEGFNIAMDEARQKARSARNKTAGDSIAMDADATAVLHRKGVTTTDDSYKFIWNKDHKTVVKAIYTGSEFIETAAAGCDIGIVLESTSFYAEQGGQIYDTGLLEGSFGSFQVSNVQIFGGYVLHIGSFSGETKILSVGDEVICRVDYHRRSLIAPNHTCTHMLNFALREVLGDHVDQKGSIVLPEKLRFDFSHGKPIHPEDLRKIESIVNKQIKDELDVFANEATLAAAKRVAGLRAVFGEVYPDPVRIVSIGRKVEDLLVDPENKEWLSYSTELCGGTHISNTREAKAFALLSEEGIAKGVRRVTAVTTDCAVSAKELADSIDAEITDASKADGSLLEKKVASLKSKTDGAAIPAARKADMRARISQLEDQIRKAKKKIGEENIQKAIKVATEFAEAAASEGKSFCISRVDVGADTTAVREAVLKVMEQKGLAVMLFSTDEASNKAVVYAGVPNSRSKEGLAVLEWLTAAMGPIKGRGGGGKNGVAQGQGSDVSRVEEAMDLASKFAAVKLK